MKWPFCLRLNHCAVSIVVNVVLHPLRSAMRYALEFEVSEGTCGPLPQFAPFWTGSDYCLPAGITVFCRDVLHLPRECRIRSASSSESSPPEGDLVP
jgi:hypothetical protein